MKGSINFILGVVVALSVVNFIEATSGRARTRTDDDDDTEYRLAVLSFTDTDLPRDETSRTADKLKPRRSSFRRKNGGEDENNDEYTTESTTEANMEDTTNDSTEKVKSGRSSYRRKFGGKKGSDRNADDNDEYTTESTTESNMEDTTSDSTEKIKSGRSSYRRKHGGKTTTDRDDDNDFTTESTTEYTTEDTTDDTADGTTEVPHHENHMHWKGCDCEAMDVHAKTCRIKAPARKGQFCFCTYKSRGECAGQARDCPADKRDTEECQGNCTTDECCRNIPTETDEQPDCVGSNRRTASQSAYEKFPKWN